MYRKPCLSALSCNNDTLTIITPAVLSKVLKGQMRETRYTVTPPGEHVGNDHIGSDRIGNDQIGNSQIGNNHQLECGGQLVEDSAFTFSHGTVTYIEDSMGYHKMENPSVTEECISLHLYSPGITECTTWADPSSIRWA